MKPRALYKNIHYSYLVYYTQKKELGCFVREDGFKFSNWYQDVVYPRPVSYIFCDQKSLLAQVKESILSWF